VIQLCAVLMAWLAVEDGGMRKFIEEKVGLEDIRETIKGMRRSGEGLTVEQLKNVEEPEGEEGEVERINAREEKEILEVLIDILGGSSEGASSGNGE